MELPGVCKEQGHDLYGEACGLSWKPPATQVSPDFPWRRRRGEVPVTLTPSLRPRLDLPSRLWGCSRQDCLKPR